ncbi:hypothetical protein D3C86_2004320 [compost metagenome]
MVAEIEPLLMIRPPCGLCAFIARKADWVQKNAPVRLELTTVNHCSGVVSSSGTRGALTPALLTSRSSRPQALTTASKAA